MSSRDVNQAFEPIFKMFWLIIYSIVQQYAHVWALQTNILYNINKLNPTTNNESLKANKQHKTTLACGLQLCPCYFKEAVRESFIAAFEAMWRVGRPLGHADLAPSEAAAAWCQHRVLHHICNVQKKCLLEQF